jgi:hypothetical protein
MGASNRLAILARSLRLSEPESAELAETAAMLASAAQRLERVLAARRQG